MNKYQELLETIKLRGIPVIKENFPEFIEIQIEKTEEKSWKNLFIKLNKVHDNSFLFSVSDKLKNIWRISFLLKDEKSLQILIFAILKEEYKNRHIFSQKIYDVKLGVSCNNNCLHCVIKPNVIDIKRDSPEDVILDSGIGMQYLKDSSYEDTIAKLSFDSVNTGVFVLTGGEPTIRADFVQILKWLYYNRPNSTVAIQTNGRNLVDENLVKAIYRYSHYPSFAVALHGTEDIHNKIVNNRKEAGNPYEETIDGIKNLIKYFGIGYIRTEMVISNYNLLNLTDSIYYQHKALGVKRIGLSYPHLEGFSKKDVEIIAPKMSEIIPILKELNGYAKNNPDVNIMFEEIPFCIFAQIAEPIHLNIFGVAKREVSLCNFQNEKISDFSHTWYKCHSKPKTCNKCLISKYCPGVWKENKKMNQAKLIPVKTITSHTEKLFLKMQRGEC